METIRTCSCLLSKQASIVKDYTIQPNKGKIPFLLRKSNKRHAIAFKYIVSSVSS